MGFYEALLLKGGSLMDFYESVPRQKDLSGLKRRHYRHSRLLLPLSTTKSRMDSNG
jgi:hypothetical protein